MSLISKTLISDRKINICLRKVIEPQKVRIWTWPCATWPCAPCGCFLRGRGSRGDYTTLPAGWAHHFSLNLSLLLPHAVVLFLSAGNSGSLCPSSKERLIHWRAATVSFLSCCFSHRDHHSCFRHFCRHVQSLHHPLFGFPNWDWQKQARFFRHDWSGQKMLGHLFLALHMVPLSMQLSHC